MNYIEDLCEFLDMSPVNFWAAAQVTERLNKAGFTRLTQTDSWTLTPGDKRYVVVNNSAVFAFVVGKHAHKGFNIIASHSDSPGFRIKPRCEIPCEGGAVKLNTEVYGGPILYTWFDRPLSMAGRVVLRGSSALSPKVAMVNFQKPLMVIPHLAIHFNRAVNEGNKLSKQKDMLPVVALGSTGNRGSLIKGLLQDTFGFANEDILDYDLSLYPCQPATTVGVNNEMLCSGRIDDLSMVHASTTAFVECAEDPSDYTRVLAVFDNEETGSGTKQGAGSTAFEHVLRRITACLGGTEEDFYRALADSFLISADNAHGYHPNYGEKYDPTNHPVLGGGPCIKINANCKYMTDAPSAAVFASLCEEADVPCQYFVNHSDVAGGSTLGNILTSSLPIRGVDMGAPVWAMHSACETASTADHVACIKAFRNFYGK